MGACCSCHMGVRYRDDTREEKGFNPREDSEVGDNDQIVSIGDCGARVRIQGSTKFISMFTRQGRKGTNQDSMTVWENFGGERGVVYCGIFDGHGPYGHKVSQYVRDTLPSKLSWLFRDSKIHNKACIKHDHRYERKVIDLNESNDPAFASWKSSIIESFKEMDEDLEAETSINSYSSGTTSVSVLKQDDNLIIANLGDSRAILCTRTNDDQIQPVQLTVDLKPNLPSEYERIKSRCGRVQAMEHEPSVYRVWMPDQDCPGLAMSRAFGDFCLKDYGLICVPNIYYRKLTDQDEFVVLATDGIWDVLTNDEVVKIVASVKKRSMAARFLVDHAIRAWRYKFPTSKIDDCAVVILFFNKYRPLLTKSSSERTHLSLNTLELDAINNPQNIGDDGIDTVLNCDIKEDENNPRKAAKKSKARDH